ncbi:hypothetical protein BG004_001345 [Podila humilis]|nr:hypothetical protein BG004_001345 [Podila humilis]
MVPLTPQGGNSRLPKGPSIGGPVPFGHQRRSLLPNPNTPQAIASDHQAQQLAEALAIHSSNNYTSPAMHGVVDTETPLPTALNSPVNYTNNTNNNNPTLASPLALRNTSAASTKNRRPSATARVGMSPTHVDMIQNTMLGAPAGMTSPHPGSFGSHSGSSTQGKYSRSNSLSSGLSVLGQQHQQHMTSFSASSSSSSSPTSESSPLSARTSMTTRLSTTSAGSNSVAAARAAYMKQPLFQRPTTTSPSGPPGGPSLGSLMQHAAKTSAPATLSQPLQLPHQAKQTQRHQHPPAAASVSAAASADMPQVGDRVMVESMSLTGYLRFVGTTSFKSGVWAGIELDTPTGKNDGIVAGVAYFNCRPMCGIFVLAAKVVKSEDDLLLPFSQNCAQVAAISSPMNDTLVTPPPPPTTSSSHQQQQHQDHLKQPPQQQQQEQQQPQQKVATAAPSSHAAQAVSRISAGSRASKYIGMTATQLKQQRNGATQHASTRVATQKESGASAPSSTTSTTVASRTATNTTTNTATTVTTTGGTTRLSQLTSRVAPAAVKPRPGIGQSSGVATPSTTGQSLARPRISPTPNRLTGAPPRRMSVRSDTTENGSTVVTAPANIDQAKLPSTTGSVQETMAQQFQQLQLEFGVAIAENNMLKTEMNQTKSQMEMNRLLEKRDLSYDERVFLSKSLGRGGIEERLGQELEELHAMKQMWEKERHAMDQELKAMTEKMTQAWLDAAKAQKEHKALLHENEALHEQLRELEDVKYSQESSGIEALNNGKEHHQHELIDILQSDLEAAQVRTSSLESQLAEVKTRAVEDQESLIKAAEEAEAAIQSRYKDQLDMLRQERESLESRLLNMDAIARSSTEALEAKLEEAARDTADARTQLNIVVAQLEHEVESQHFRESVAESHLQKAEDDLQEARSLLAKSEKAGKASDELVKDIESALSKKDQEISALQSELDDLAGTMQSDEVDRMRKIWEHEKKRFEEAVMNDMTLIANLRAEIESLETNEEDYLSKITDLEEEAITLLDAKARVESELASLREQAAADAKRHATECDTLKTAADDAATALENQTEASMKIIEKLEAMTQSAETWKQSYEEQVAVASQQAINLDNLEQNISDARAKIETLDQQLQETLIIKKNLEEKMATLTLEQTNATEDVNGRLAKVSAERDSLSSKVTELEDALALAASSAQSTTDSANTTLNQSELDDEISHLKQMVHDLTRENVTVVNVNKKLMQEHDNLMEAHRHVETECLKLMDEVERLHSESLAAEVTLDESITGDDARADAEEILSTESKGAAPPPKLAKSIDYAAKDQAPTSGASASVIRLESILKDKQALLDRLTQQHSTEMRELRQRYVELDRSKAFEIAQLNKELTDLESLIESKIFHEADLEEEVHRKQNQIERLQQEINDLTTQLSKVKSANGGGPSTNGHGSPASGKGSSPYLQSADYRATSTTPQQRNYRSPSMMSGSSMASTPPRRGAEAMKSSLSHDDQVFCEICEVYGHDIISCSAVFGTTYNNTNNTNNNSSIMEEEGYKDDRPYCENCEEYGLHYTDECPNESQTY